MEYDFIRGRLEVENVGEQTIGFGFEGAEVGSDVGNTAQLRGLVEVFGERKFITHLRFLFRHIGIGGIGQHFVAQESIYSTRIAQRHLLRVAKRFVGFTCHRMTSGVDFCDEFTELQQQGLGHLAEMSGKCVPVVERSGGRNGC